MLYKIHKCQHCGVEFAVPRRGGRPPATCSPSCRTAYRSSQRAEQREDAAFLAEDPRHARDRAEDERRIAAWEVGRVERQAAAMLRSGAMIAGDALRGMDDKGRGDEAGPGVASRGLVMDSWADRTVVAEDRDPALAWLAANAPEALADFPRAAHVGDSHRHLGPVLGDEAATG